MMVLGVRSISTSVHDQSADRIQSAGRARCITFDEILVTEDYKMFNGIELELRVSYQVHVGSFRRV